MTLIDMMVHIIVTKILSLHSGKYIIIMIRNFLRDIVAYEHVRDMDNEKY